MEVQEATSVGSFLADWILHSTQKMSGVSPFGKGGCHQITVSSLMCCTNIDRRRALNAADGDTASRLIGRAGGGTSQRQQ